MTRLFARPVVLCATLLVLSAIPILVSAVRLVQIPAGALPVESLKFTATPVSHFLHALGGVLFGVLGPFQFAGVLRRRFGRLHKITGRLFVGAGILLAGSSLPLLVSFPGSSTWLLDGARGLAALAVLVALTLGVRAIIAGNRVAHRAWMIRAYAVGMGSATVALVMFPIFLLTGQAPVGMVSDAVFVGSWVANILLAEWVIARPLARVRGVMA